MVALLFVAVVTVGVSWAARRDAVENPIAVSLTGNLATTLDPANLIEEATLERRIAALPGVRAVLGPSSFLRGQATGSAGEIRRQVALMHPAGHAAARRDLATVLVHYGYVGLPSLDNRSFIGQLLFGSGTVPQRRFRRLFPDVDHARMLVGLREPLSDGRARALRSEIARLTAGAQLQGVQASMR